MVLVSGVKIPVNVVVVPLTVLPTEKVETVAPPALAAKTYPPNGCTATETGFSPVDTAGVDSGDNAPVPLLA